MNPLFDFHRLDDAHGPLPDQRLLLDIAGPASGFGGSTGATCDDLNMSRKLPFSENETEEEELT
jgi:hypothetical protein